MRATLRARCAALAALLAVASASTAAAVGGSALGGSGAGEDGIPGTRVIRTRVWAPSPEEGADAGVEQELNGGRFNPGARSCHSQPWVFTTAMPPVLWVLMPAPGVGLASKSCAFELLTARSTDVLYWRTRHVTQLLWRGLGGIDRFLSHCTGMADLTSLALLQAYLPKGPARRRARQVLPSSSLGMLRTCPLQACW